MYNFIHKSKHTFICYFIPNFISNQYRKCYVLILICAMFLILAILFHCLTNAELIHFRFSLFHHPEVTQEFLEINKGNTAKEQFCKEIAKPGYEVVASMPSPRFIKSHFPFSLLPGILDVGCKVITNKRKNI